MKPYPSVFHAYTSKLRPATVFLSQINSMRFPTVFRQPLKPKSACVSLTLSVRPYIHLSIHPSSIPVHPSVHPSIHVSTSPGLSIHARVYLPVDLYLSSSFFMIPPLSLSLYLSPCLPVCLSVCLSVHATTNFAITHFCN